MLIFLNWYLSGRTKIQLTLNIRNSILKPDKQEGTLAKIARKSLDFSSSIKANQRGSSSSSGTGQPFSISFSPPRPSSTFTPSFFHLIPSSSISTSYLLPEASAWVWVDKSPRLHWAAFSSKYQIDETAVKGLPNSWSHPDPCKQPPSLPSAGSWGPTQGSLERDQLGRAVMSPSWVTLRMCWVSVCLNPPPASQDWAVCYTCDCSWGLL